MKNEKRISLLLSDKNNHLLDVFSDNLYLELGTISEDALNLLLRKKIVDYKDLSSYDIIKNGIGSIQSSSQEMNHKLPFIRFNNMILKNKSNILVLTYGLLLQKRGYKESFAPIILIPIKMYFEDDTIIFQMISKPFVNPMLKLNKTDKKVDYSNSEKFNNIYALDKYILGLVKQRNLSVRLENYITFVNTKHPELQLAHDKFSLENKIVNNLTEVYVHNNESDIYNITPLDRVQRNAMQLSLSGNSFAITGYDGTGKTTTLINIAANAIKNGKTVLYVSNNDNTLNTVYKAFENINLETSVSLLTNSFIKVNDKTHDVKKGKLIEKLLKEEIISCYDKIDDYENQLSSKLNNYLAIEVMKELITTPQPNELFDNKIMENAKRLYKYEINEVLKALDIIDDQMKNIPSFANSHFINIPITHQIKNVNEPMELLQKIHDCYCILNEEKDLLEKNYGFKNIENYAYFKTIILNYLSLEKNNVPLSWYDLKEDNFNVFSKAAKTFINFKEDILKSRSIEQAINNRYKEIDNYDVKKAIKEITSNIFDVKNVALIDDVLRDYKKINDEVEKAKQYCNDLESSFEKFKEKLKLNIDLSNTKVINEILDFVYVLDKGFFAKVWCDYDQQKQIYSRMKNIETILDGYEESILVHNKYFDNISNLDINIANLEKKNKDENSKYHGVLIKTILPHLYYIRKHNINILKLKKEYKDLTYAEYKYKQHISDVYKEFIEKHDKISDKNLRIQIENSFQDLRGSAIIDILSIAKEFKKAILNVYVAYDFFDHYKIIGKADNIVLKITKIREVFVYIEQLVGNQSLMRDKLVDKNETILFETYSFLNESLDTFNKIINKINSNKDYEFLYSKLFNGYETDIVNLEKMINNFKSYINIFNDKNSLVNSFEDGLNDVILVHLNNSNKVINDISELFQNYIKLFKSAVSKFYYDDFKKVIDEFKLLLESKEELRVYLKIADAMKVLLKYKLYNLNNYIIFNNKEKVKNRFKYSYFKYLYQVFLSKNEDFINVNKYESILEDLMFKEKDLIDNNIEMVKLSNVRGYRTGKARHLNYNQYVIKNKGARLLYLTDTSIANIFLDISNFDLVLIDDAHLMHANEYYKVVSCPQVIIAGAKQLQTTVSNNLISHIRNHSIIEYKYRYSKTPLNNLMLMDNIKGRFYSKKEHNKGIRISKENYIALILKLYRENHNCRINFFTASLTKANILLQNISNVLYDRGLSIYEINNFFKENVNISDLQEGYMIDADYNILDLESYSNINEEYLSINMINMLLCCDVEIIILDDKNILSEEETSKFIEHINLIKKPVDLNLYLPEDSVIERLSKGLVRYRIKTIGSFKPINLVVEYDGMYFGIIIIENPDTTDFTLLNEYREFKSIDFPITIVWLSDLVENYNKTLQRIVKEIRS